MLHSIGYYKTMPGFNAETMMFTDLGKFFKYINDKYGEGFDLLIAIEPGDATRYELVICRTTFESKFFAVPDKEYSSMWGHGIGVPESALPFDNKYTRCVYADVINMRPYYYDWVKSMPIDFKRETPNENPSD